MNLKIIYTVIVFLLFVSKSYGQEKKCDFSQNPHSWSCMKDTFENKTVFPIKLLNQSIIFGNWKPIVVADPTRENQTSEFITIFKDTLNKKPLHLLNRTNQRKIGSLEINEQQYIFNDWLTSNFKTTKQNFFLINNITLAFSIFEAQTTHRFVCRIFVRSSIDHLICLWQTKEISTQFSDKAFIGFLK